MYSITHNDDTRKGVFEKSLLCFEKSGGYAAAVVMSRGNPGYKPYTDKSGNIWVKAGPDKRRVTAREELQRMLQNANLLTADEAPVVGSAWDDLEPAHVMQFLEKHYGVDPRSALRDNAIDARRILGNLGLMRGEELTLSGLLLFGLNPQRFRPVDVLKCVHFPGNEISDMDYIDSQDFSGTIRDLHKGAMAFLERNLRHAQNGQGFNSIGIPTVPMEALEEYVVNMLLHRDYFVRAPWRIFIFANRIELISPGSLPENLTIEQMKSGVSSPRNPRLFSYSIKDGIPYRGIGSGVRRALKLYTDVSFENDEGGLFFKAVVSYDSPKENNMGDNRGDNRGNNRENNRGNNGVIVRMDDLPSEQLKICEIILSDPSISVRKIAENLHIRFTTVFKQIKALKSKGVLVRKGGTRGHWRVIQ